MRQLKRKAGKGITILEVMVVLFIFSLLLVPTLTVFHKSQQKFALESGVKEILAVLEMARASALHERKNFQVVFGESSFAVYREGKELVDKLYRLPEHIIVVEKTKGFDPVVFLTDGTSQQAGHLVVAHEKSGVKKRLILYNLTGKCLVQ